MRPMPEAFRRLGADLVRLAVVGGRPCGGRHEWRRVPVQHPRSIIPSLAVLALAGALTAGCGSSSGPADSSSGSAAPAASASADALSAADCAVIKPLAADAATSLAPVKAEPTAQASTTMATYISTLGKALAEVTSAQGKADLDAFIDDLKAAGAANADKVEAAIQKLAADCP
jgi:hypothetical protein